MKKIIINVIITVFVFLGLTSPGYADSNNQLQALSWTNQKIGSDIFSPSTGNESLGIE